MFFVVTIITAFWLLFAVLLYFDLSRFYKKQLLEKDMEIEYYKCCANDAKCTIAMLEKSVKENICGEKIVLH